MYERLCSLLLAMPLLVIVGCQVVSGLTGVDLDGKGTDKDGGTMTACEKADQRIEGCNQALSVGHINATFPPACSRPNDECRASCYLHGTCIVLLTPTKAPLSTCLAHCK